jgi:excisionase family DNA binding protein
VSQPNRERWPALLSRQQAAEYLGCSLTQLDVLRADPQQPIRSVMLGGLVRFRRRELDEFIELLEYGGKGHGHAARLDIMA